MASSVQRQQEQRRRMLLMEITSIIYLLRQGLALRGHVDEESNLIQLLKLRSIDDSDLQDWINDKKYLSHDIVNEITKEISLTIVRDIVKQDSTIRHDGEWQYDKMHGRGVYTYANGDRYDSQWQYDKMQGRGVVGFISATANYYE
ncbi:unnamed protein product, partial [Didymodactylos carnosus]